MSWLHKLCPSSNTVPGHKFHMERHDGSRVHFTCQKNTEYTTQKSSGLLHQHFVRTVNSTEINPLALIKPFQSSIDRISCVLASASGASSISRVLSSTTSKFLFKNHTYNEHIKYCHMFCFQRITLVHFRNTSVVVYR